MFPLRTVSFVFLLPAIASAQSPSLAFSPAGDGLFSFDTGAVRGILRAAENTHGIISLIESETGLEIAHGGDYPGILSFYRCFTTCKRYPDWRETPPEAKILPGGVLQLEWRETEESPYLALATYAWTSPNILDLNVMVQSRKKLPDFEVFLSSYLTPGFEGFVYARQPAHNPRPDGFIKADVNPLVLGTYLLFPRDPAAARLFFDGRWQFPAESGSMVARPILQASHRHQTERGKGCLGYLHGAAE